MPTQIITTSWLNAFRMLPWWLSKILIFRDILITAHLPLGNVRNSVFKDTSNTRYTSSRGSLLVWSKTWGISMIMHNFPSTSATISFPGRLNSTSSLAIVSLKRGWMLRIWIWWRRISSEGFGWSCMHGSYAHGEVFVGERYLCLWKESMLDCHQLCHPATTGHPGSDFNCASHLTVYNQAGKHMLPSATTSPLFKNSTDHLGITKFLCTTETQVFHQSAWF